MGKREAAVYTCSGVGVDDDDEGKGRDREIEPLPTHTHTHTPIRKADRVWCCV